jgi:hypothetical protein
MCLMPHPAAANKVLGPNSSAGTHQGPHHLLKVKLSVPYHQASSWRPSMPESLVHKVRDLRQDQAYIELCCLLSSRTTRLLGCQGGLAVWKRGCGRQELDNTRSRGVACISSCLADWNKGAINPPASQAETPKVFKFVKHKLAYT